MRKPKLVLNVLLNLRNQKACPFVWRSTQCEAKSWHVAVADPSMLIRGRRDKGSIQTTYG